jgi:hypothetical protein
MNIRELQQVLTDKKVSPAAYSLNRGEKNESYVMLYEAGSWFVFYSERGLRSGCKSFNDESSACLCILNLILEDPTTPLVI